MTSGVKISALPPAAPITGAETIPVVQTGVTKQTQVSTLGIPYDHSGEQVGLAISGRWNITQGTYAAPIVTAYPTIRMDKFESITQGSGAGQQPNPVDNGYNALIALYPNGNPDTQVQTCGLWSWARGGGNVPNADVCAVIGVGDVIWDQPRGGSGGYFEGRKNFTQSNIGGVELRASNFAPTADTFNPQLIPLSNGAWITAGGYHNCATAVGIAYLDPACKWDVGIGIYRDAVATAVVYDDGSSVTGYLDTGSHAYGIDLSGATYSGAPIAAPFKTPASAAAAGKAGSICWDANYVYICTATNTWKRTAIATW